MAHGRRSGLKKSILHQIQLKCRRLIVARSLVCAYSISPGFGRGPSAPCNLLILAPRSCESKAFDGWISTVQFHPSLTEKRDATAPAASINGTRENVASV